MLVSWHHLDWMQDLVKRGALHEESFRMYAASDIDAYHARMRSAFDYLATIIWGGAENRELVKKFRSFNDLVKWIKEKRHVGGIGPVAEFIASRTEWFRGLRKVRDTSIHHGGFTLVFPMEEVGFMSLQPGSLFTAPASVLPKEVMCNDNVVDFRKYAVVHLCWFIELAEEGMHALLHRWKVQPDANTRATGGGVEMLRLWADALAGKLRA